MNFTAIAAEHSKHGIKAIAYFTDSELGDLHAYAKNNGNEDLMIDCEIQLDCNDLWERENQ